MHANDVQGNPVQESDSVCFDEEFDERKQKTRAANVTGGSGQKGFGGGGGFGEGKGFRGGGKGFDGKGFGGGGYSGGYGGFDGGGYTRQTPSRYVLLASNRFCIFCRYAAFADKICCFDLRN